MTLTAEQLEQVQEYTGPAAWTYHQALPEAAQVNLPRSLRVWQDLRLVAAAVLSAACTEARRAGAQAAGEAVKGVKLGGIEVQLNAAQAGAAQNGDADNWCALAASLRADVAASRRETTAPGSLSLPVEVGF